MAGLSGLELAAPLASLGVVDARIDALSPERRSMSGGRSRATTLAALCETLLRDEDPPALQVAFVRGLAGLAQAQLEHFPENIFFDLDYPASDLLGRGRGLGPDEGVALVTESFALMAELQGLYGVHTPIRFRYVHDFSYGFDWAKWVAREPAQSGGVGPFDLEFLRYMRRRAHELLDLIAADDHKYPTLRDEGPRNPFPFSREPHDELRLHRELARRGLVPVEAWRRDATPVWDRPFADLRVEVAEELDLLVRAS